MQEKKGKKEQRQRGKE
jgi:hypothetical protein